MSTPALHEAGQPESRLDALAAYFRERPGIWLDARQLAQVGGLLSWRTRVSELRRPPHSLAIANRTRRYRSVGGRMVTASEYRLEVVAPRGGRL